MLAEVHMALFFQYGSPVESQRGREIPHRHQPPTPIECIEESGGLVGALLKGLKRANGGYTRRLDIRFNISDDGESDGWPSGVRNMRSKTDQNGRSCLAAPSSERVQFFENRVGFEL